MLGRGKRMSRNAGLAPRVIAAAKPQLASA
jgi:hypothetical protein